MEWSGRRRRKKRVRIRNTRGVCDGWYFDGGKIFIAEVSALSFCPGKRTFVDLEDVLGKAFFIWP